ncbi:MAG: response regulator [Gammaproteobacteria bacterium]
MSDAQDKALKGLKVLVVDDSNTIRRAMEILLQKEGCDVATACDGFEALSKIVDHQPDIMFVDVVMPRLDGYQTCSLIKSNEQFKHIPVIMLSSKDGLFDRARGRNEGADDYVTKPFSSDDVIEVITRHTSRPGSTAEAPS